MPWLLAGIVACADELPGSGDARFVAVRWGPVEVCGLTDVGTLECSPPIWDVPAAILGALPILDFEGNYGFVCTVSAVEGALCAEPIHREGDFPAPIEAVRGSFASVRVAERRVCAGDTDGVVQCWGDGAADPASGAEQKALKSDPYVSWDIGDLGARLRGRGERRDRVLGRGRGRRPDGRAGRRLHRGRGGVQRVRGP